MGAIPDKERKMLEKIDYAGDFDKELAKYEKPRRQQARDMMRTSLPTEPRYREDVDPDGSDLEDMKAGRIKPKETKQDLIRRKKKELGIVGQLTESELKTMKRSMSANERKMLSSK